MADNDTVKIHYSASSNLSFHGEIDTEIPREKWKKMTDAERDAAVDEEIYNLIDVSVEE